MPTVTKHSIHFVHGDYLASHLRHEIEIIGSQRTSYIEIGRSPVPPRFTVGRAGHPFGMGCECFFGAGVGIGAGDDVHSQAAAALSKLAERITGAKKFAAIVKRDFGGIKGYTTTGAEAGGVGVNLLEVPQPHCQIVVAGVILCECHLSPAHRPVEPASILRERCLRKCNLLPKGNSRTASNPFTPCNLHNLKYQLVVSHSRFLLSLGRLTLIQPSEKMMTTMNLHPSQHVLNRRELLLFSAVAMAEASPLESMIISVHVMFDQGAHSGQGLGDRERSKFHAFQEKTAREYAISGIQFELDYLEGDYSRKQGFSEIPDKFLALEKSTYSSPTHLGMIRLEAARVVLPLGRVQAHRD